MKLNKEMGIAIIVAIIIAIIAIMVSIYLLLSFFQSKSKETRLPLPFDSKGNLVTEYNDSQKLKETLENTLKRAQEEQNPDICTELPLEGVVYYYSLDQGERYAKTKMRSECLYGYMRFSPISKVCYLMSEISKEDRYFLQSMDDCFKYAAEKEKDSKLCKLVVDPDAKTECQALVTKDARICLVITNIRKEPVFEPVKILDYLTDRSVSAGSCIQAVVFRTQEYKTCSLIDGSKFGKYWTFLRNECLNVAGYLLQKEGKLQNDSQNEICGLYVPGIGNKNCGRGTFIDPNNFWKLEMENIYHVLPDSKELKD